MMIQYDKMLENKHVKELIEWIQVIVIAFILALVIKTYVIETTKVLGPSMQDTLVAKERLFVCKFSYKFGDPKRGDIIVFNPKNTKSNYIKRVIGLPGDVIDIESGKVFVNDKELIEEYAKGETYQGIDHVDFPYTVGDGEYFVLGDNRMHSEDSRDVRLGKVTKENIKGKAIYRCYPFNNMGTFKRPKYN